MCVCVSVHVRAFSSGFVHFVHSGLTDTHTNMPVSISACVKPAECEEATFQEAKAQTVKRWA